MTQNVLERFWTMTFPADGLMIRILGNFLIVAVHSADARPLRVNLVVWKVFSTFPRARWRQSPLEWSLCSDSYSGASCWLSSTSQLLLLNHKVHCGRVNPLVERDHEINVDNNHARISESCVCIIQEEQQEQLRGNEKQCDVHPLRRRSEVDSLKENSICEQLSLPADVLIFAVGVVMAGIPLCGACLSFFPRIPPGALERFHWALKQGSLEKLLFRQRLSSKLNKFLGELCRKLNKMTLGCSAD